MKGVIGLLLAVAGLEVCYLVLAGKLPLSSSSSSSSSSSTPTSEVAGEGKGGLDFRQLVRYRAGSRNAAAVPIPSWGGIGHE